MIGLVVRRLAAMIPLLLFVSFVVFSLITLVPGDPATTLAGGTDADFADIEAIREEMNLNDPFLVQYAKWLGGAVQGDFGESLLSGRPVYGEVKRAIPPTLGLVAATLILVIPVGLLLGLISGLRPGSVRDKSVLTFTSAGIAMPSFWVALLLVSFFAVRLKWLPPFGYEPFVDSPTEWAKRMIMPAIALSASAIAVVSRQLRGGLADVMTAPYIRTAWAKGGSGHQVIAGHALKNAAMPAVTVLGLQTAVLLGGSIIIEQIFTIPGLGTYLLRAINQQDLPSIQAVALLYVVINVMINLIVDIAYGFLNPKVRAA
ncbi:MAG: ABC transporter permease [Ilumatobacteraceae bacterium]